jgi:hypothetical protein
VDVTGLFDVALRVVEISGDTARVLAPFFGGMHEVKVAAAQLAKAAG